MSSVGNRIDLIDALRGFSLLAIALAHFSEQYLGYQPPTEHLNYARHNAVDSILDVLCFVFIRGKGFALFSFMFGLSFWIQMQRAAEKENGDDFRIRFAWRLIVLLGIGYLHSLVYRGDILMIYSILGLLLIPMRNVPDRWLWIIGLCLILGGPRILTSLTLPEQTPEQQMAIQERTQAQAQEHWLNLTEGSFWTIASSNGVDAFSGRFEFQFGPISRGFQTFGLFLIGLWAGRIGLLSQPQSNQLVLKRMFRWGGILTLVIPLVGSAIVYGLIMAFPQQQTESGAIDLFAWPVVVGLCFYDAWNFAMTLFVVALFVRLYLGDRFASLTRSFTGVGKTALTCYVTQSIVGLILFAGFGFGLLGRVGTSVTLPICLLVFATQMLVSRWWLARFSYGPLEWFWRCLTYGKLLPLRLSPT